MSDNWQLKKSVHPINLPMWLDPGGGGINPALLYYEKGRELAFMKILDQTVKPGMIAIDLGANIGYTTLAIAKNVGSRGYIYCIEPDPRSLPLLRKNLEYNNFNNICEIHECVISDKNSRVEFFLSDHPNLSGLHKESYHKYIDSITSNSYTLTNFLEDKKYPNFIKMDVEGAEVGIFEGALEYFTDNKGETHFLVEIHPYVGDLKCTDPNRDFVPILREFVEIGFNIKYMVSTCYPTTSLQYRQMGYDYLEIIQTDGFERAIYTGVENEDAFEIACREPQGARSMLFSREAI